jgi:glycosyltransferase involved in cell wall biosynthesis
VKVSAYIPCYNNSATLEQAISSIRKQSIAVAELFILDDASTDPSREIAAKLGVRVVRNSRNLGRGAVRARAILIAHNDFVLSCDATNVLTPDFLECAISRMDSSKVAAVFGVIMQEPGGSVLARWRARHLFRSNAHNSMNRKASLATYGLLMRRSLVLAAGNFCEKLTHSEDAELGERLLERGFEVVYDPNLKVIAKGGNRLGPLMERYWRWNAGKSEGMSCLHYLRQIVYSIKVMAMEDLKAKDPAGIPLSLLTPHYQFWKSVIRKHRISR